jgi:hypothetical protein
VRSLLLFVPALFFGLLALVSSALAFKGDQLRDPEEVIGRNRLASQVAIVLCALSLLAGAGLLILQALPLGD